MLTLYGDLDSGNVYKVRLLLAQLGIACRRVDTTQNRGETASAEFRAINPIGKIPTIVFDDGRMPGSSPSNSTSRPYSPFFCRKGAGVEHDDLDVNDIGAAGDAVGIPVTEVRGVMLCDGHELVVFGHVQCFAHRAVDAVEDRLPVGLRLAGTQ